MFVYCVREYTMCNIVNVIHVSLELDTCCGASYIVPCCLEFEHIRYSSGRLLIFLEYMSEGVVCLSLFPAYWSEQWNDCSYSRHSVPCLVLCEHRAWLLGFHFIRPGSTDYLFSFACCSNSIIVRVAKSWIADASDTRWIFVDRQWRNIQVEDGMEWGNGR
jgi:hypothetical protein